MWVLLSLLAGSLQVWRNASLRALGRSVPHLLSTWARFTFLLPFVGTVLLVTALVWPWPQLGPGFWGWTAACALFQSTANLCLAAAFRSVPFSRVVVLHKLEVAMAPFAGALWFHEVPSQLAVVGILLCVCGAIALNAAARPGAPLRSLWRLDRGSSWALGSAVSVVLASYFLKQGTLAFVADNAALPDGRSHFLAAVHALVHASWLQSLVLLLWIRLRSPQQFRFLRTHLRGMLRLGAASAACSMCWFWAYSLQLVAYVKALGQIEVVVAALFSHFLLKERGVLRLLPAIGLVLAGILLVLLG